MQAHPDSWTKPSLNVQAQFPIIETVVGAEVQFSNLMQPGIHHVFRLYKSRKPWFDLLIDILASQVALQELASIKNAYDWTYSTW
jgi:hypothetical protein